MAAASRALRRAVEDDARVVARYLITTLTVPGYECLWWSADVAVGGAGWLWVEACRSAAGPASCGSLLTASGTHSATASTLSW